MKRTTLAPQPSHLLLSHFGPEAELLLRCSRAQIDAASAERIAEIVAAGVDWDRVVALARQNGVVTLLYQGLQDSASAVPQAVLERIQAEFLAHTQHSLKLSGELVRLSAAFEAAGVPAIALKGPALATLAYGNLALRSSVDLDILVRRADIARARDILLAQGYGQKEHVAAAQLDAYLAAQHHFSFVRGDMLVELHHALRERFFGYPVDLDQIWSRSAPVAIGRQEVRALGYQDQIVTLCMHGTGHRWDRLIWICDIAELLRQEAEIDWASVLAELRAKGAERMLLLGMYLAHTLLGAPAPALAMQRAARDQAVRELLGRVLDRLFVYHDQAPGIPETAGFYLRARERRRDRARYLLLLALTPTLGDWSLVALPRRLSWLYYLLRPVRLAWAYRARLYSRA